MKKTFALFGLILITKFGFPCSCWTYEPNFYKNVSSRTFNCIAVFDTMDYSYEYNRLKGQTGYFILIDTIGNFSSTIGDTIIVTGQDGLNCGEMLNGFSRGDTMFLALSNGFYKSYEKDTFYLEGLCGKYFLKIENGQYSGLTIPEIKDKIFSVLERNSSACFCSNYGGKPGFYNNISNETLNCLVVFKKYDYSYDYDGLKSQTGYFILLDTISNFDTQIGDTIIVIGEDGINCGEMLNRFSNGDTLFLALSEGYYETFEKDTFYLKGGTCGYYFLKITHGQNNGLTVSEIKDKIKSVITDVNDINREKHFSIYPNPTNARISIDSDVDLIRNIQIYDTSGQLKKSINEVNRMNIEIDLTYFSSGIYFVLINTDKGHMYNKIVKK